MTATHIPTCEVCGETKCVCAKAEQRDTKEIIDTAHNIIIAALAHIPADRKSWPCKPQSDDDNLSAIAQAYGVLCGMARK